MSLTPQLDIDPHASTTLDSVAFANALTAARSVYWEEPDSALDVAVQCMEHARGTGHSALQSRAFTLQGAVSMHRGDLQGAFELAANAELHAGDDVEALAELHALTCHLQFFAGAYSESLRHAELAVDYADMHGVIGLRVHVRRMACVAFGNVGVDDLTERIKLTLELALENGDPWEIALSRNDYAHDLMQSGEVAAAEEQLSLAESLLEANRPVPRFALGVLHCTRSEVLSASGRRDEGLRSADRAIGHLISGGDANPYILGMAVLAKVQALLALDRVEDARRTGERVVERLGDRVPQARAMILSAVAGALRAAGRPEEAYDTLARGAELERQAMQEFSRLQLGLERTRLEMTAARREADALSRKNRELHELLAELADAHAALEKRTRQLLELQDQLREQADRDFLTGLGNRRFLARARDEASPDEAMSVAVLDLDHFKAINDECGHLVGDEVLVRVAAMLVDHLRTQDTVVRSGGEEFVLLMPGAGLDEAAACCERVREMIATAPWDDVAPGITVTASFGVASAAGGHDFATLERDADARLYAAKRAGRNRVICAD